VSWPRAMRSAGPGTGWNAWPGRRGAASSGTRRAILEFIHPTPPPSRASRRWP
jgi:hypothetical protein